MRRLKVLIYIHPGPPLRVGSPQLRCFHKVLRTLRAEDGFRRPAHFKVNAIGGRCAHLATRLNGFIFKGCSGGNQWTNSRCMAAGRVVGKTPIRSPNVFLLLLGNVFNFRKLFHTTVRGPLFSVGGNET